MKYSDLKGKIVVIAGANGLLGKALAKGFIEQSSTIVLASRSKEKEKKLECFISL